MAPWLPDISQMNVLATPDGIGLRVLRNPLLLATTIAVVVRLAFFLGAIAWPIPNEALFPVSPLNLQGYADFDFYLKSLEQYRSLTPLELLKKFIAFYQRPFQEQFGHIIAGPVFPSLLHIFDYRAGNTLPMATAYLALGCLWSVLWLRFLWARGIGAGWLLLFAVAPNPIWFSLVISPDIVFAVLVGLFVIFYFSVERRSIHTAAWLSILVLILLTRPNGYSVLIFVIIDLAWRNIRVQRDGKWIVMTVSLLILVFGLYLYPYFITEMRKTLVDHLFFGIRVTEYSAGLFPDLPTLIDKATSLSLLVGAKVLYLVGLRPSYGETSDLLVIFRALPGLILLPGLFYVFIRGSVSERLFILMFIFPIMLGPSQDRYNLPIYPLLYYYGALFFAGVSGRLNRKRSL